MKPRLFNAIAAMSLLLCVATAALCIRSPWICDEITISKAWNDELNGEYDSSTWSLIARRHELAFDHEILDRSWSGGVSQQGLGEAFGYRLNWRISHHSDSAFLFDCWHSTISNSTSGGVDNGFAIPYLTIILAASVLPVISVCQHIRNPTRGAGLCPRCGYDLRATPDRCPECGAIPPKKIQESKPHFNVED